MFKAAPGPHPGCSPEVPRPLPRWVGEAAARRGWNDGDSNPDPYRARVVFSRLNYHPMKHRTGRFIVSARRRPRGGSNSPRLIDSQVASPDAYEGVRVISRNGAERSGRA